MARLRTTARELTGQLIVLGIALWAVAIVNAWTDTPYLRSGQVRGTDFVQFYALGRLAATGHLQSFDDFDAIRQAQLAGVPESGDVWFPPVYGPQVPLALAPLGFLSYGQALAVWVALSLGAYVWFCLLAARDTRVLGRHRVALLAGVLAFPAFWQLLQHGQLTVIAVGAIVLAWRCLSRGADWQAGALLGLLVYKPPLLAPILVVLFFARSWKIVASAVAAGILEVGVTAFWIGWDGLRRYVELMLKLPTMSTLLFTRPEQSHGLKAFWTILVSMPAVVWVLYAVSVVLVIAAAVSIWRDTKDPSRRMAALVLTVTLAAPYLFVYDLAILAPAWIWLVDWFLTADVPPRVGRVLYLGYLAPLAAPLVPVTHIQPSVLCLAFLMWALWKYRQ